MLANSFMALDSGRVKAAAIGAPGDWPVAPLAKVDGLRLACPAGVADLRY
jgi:hypothetical protein